MGLFYHKADKITESFCYIMLVGPSIVRPFIRKSFHMPLVSIAPQYAYLAVPLHLICFLIIMGYMKQPHIPTGEPFYIRVVPWTGSCHCEEGMKVFTFFTINLGNSLNQRTKKWLNQYSVELNLYESNIFPFFSGSLSSEAGRFFEFYVSVTLIHTRSPDVCFYNTTTLQEKSTFLP